ncbi:MAG: calcium/sodium antiporter [Ilumatobacter sp.]
MAVLTLLGGLVGLVITGGAIVSGASTIGLKLGLNPLVVGLTIVAAGTSAPELAVVWRAADQGDTSLALGSVIGSNIANVLLVVGIVAIIGAIPVIQRTRRVDLPVMIAASIGTYALASDGAITPRDGVFLLIGLVTYIGITLRHAMSEGPEVTNDDATSPPAGPPRPTAKRTLLAIGIFAVGAVGVAISAQFVVSGAEEIALSLGVPELVVGLTVLAVGTSAPEIVTSIIAAVRGGSDVAIGNAIGSNVFNLLFVLGLVSATHSRLPVDDELIRLDLPVMLTAAAICLPFAITGAAITRWEGFALVGFYSGYTSYLVLNGLDNRAAPVVGIATIVAIAPVGALALREFRGDQQRRRLRRRSTTPPPST